MFRCFRTRRAICAGWIVTLAIIGIVYGALVAMVQPNMKKLVAYSSVSHLGFVVLGIFSFTQQGFDGAVYQMLAHGISTGALFLLVGFLYDRRHSLEIAAYGGVATPAPWLSTAFMITMLASIGLPMLSNFIGEYLVLQGSSLVYFRWTVFAALGVDSRGLLHAVALPARVLRQGVRGFDPPHARSQLPRVRHHRSSDCSDGLDGHLHAEFPSADFRVQRRAARAHRRAARNSCSSYTTSQTAQRNRS